MKRLLLIITGSVAAYRALELIRLLKQEGVEVTSILTEGAQAFITPLSVASLSGGPVYTELFSLKDETEMGHIRLSREADAILVCPASADILAKMAAGLADDLASTTLLATNRPVWVAPAMNPQMWAHPATKRNVARLQADGVRFIGPEAGEVACGEVGEGRLASLEAIASVILSEAKDLSTTQTLMASGEMLPLHSVQGLHDEASLHSGLNGYHILVTSGPTFEAIDPVRFIGNRSSGKQGMAIAGALAARGAKVTLVSGPSALPTPPGVMRVDVESAAQMLAACEHALPVDVAICASAVSDWTPVAPNTQKIKKQAGGTPPTLTLTETPDILALLSHHPMHRPRLVVGFAAETEQLIPHASAKRLRKGCDWILANDVSGGQVFGAEENRVTCITAHGTEIWDAASKQAIAERLADEIIAFRKEPS
jgi:phosphopantothenoylcysteine decarboxylase/phosphopantothenate--cysteine ligase